MTKMLLVGDPFLLDNPTRGKFLSLEREIGTHKPILWISIVVHLPNRNWDKELCRELYAGHYWVSLVSFSFLYYFMILQGKKAP